MYRVLIAAVFHETNTFWPHVTGIEEFKKRNYLHDEAVTTSFKGTRTVLGAYFDALNEKVELIPAIAAIAEPYGMVTQDAFEEIKKNLLDKCRSAGRIDGILLSLHGAMVAEGAEDGDGEILKALRETAGNEIPIIATLDLHANLTETMVENATALIPYREYPHVDMYLRGLEAADLMLKTLHKEISPVMVWKHIPILAALTETVQASYGTIKNALLAAEQQEGILNVSFLHGFYLADTRYTGASVLVISDGEKETAQCLVNDLAEVIWAERKCLVDIKTYTPQQAIDESFRCKETVVFADICDNPGIGSSCDGTHLLRAMLHAGVMDAAYGLICDPEVVKLCHKHGVGSTISIQLGGKKNPEVSGEPVECIAYVKSLFDGRYQNQGPMHGGLTVNLQKSAVIVVTGIHIIVSSVPTQAYDAGLFLSHGLDLNSFQILVVKSSIHYKAAFSKYCRKMLSVECPGALIVDPKNVPYQSCVHPIYPLDSVVSINC